MPTKKSTTKTTAAKAAAPKEAAEHSHSGLESEITALKKELESLKSQCKSCCDSLAKLKETIDSIKSADSKSYDHRLDMLFEILTDRKHSKITTIRKDVNKIKHLK